MLCNVACWMYFVPEIIIIASVLHENLYFLEDFSSFSRFNGTVGVGLVNEGSGT